MRNKLFLSTAWLIFVLLIFAVVNAQKSESFEDNSADLAPISGNHFNVLHAMRTIHSAQFTYAQTYGAGNFGSLQSLAHFGLIDASLGSGQKDGYQFSMTTRLLDLMKQAGFDLNVTPIVRQARVLSYYQNEGCDIYAADKMGRNATVTDPVIDPCGISLRSDNERAVMESVRLLHRAQMTYQATLGVGQYGTIAQLSAAGLYNSGFALNGTWRGYQSQLIVTTGNGMTPASFTFRATPTEYGRTGVRSFYIDRSGKLRGNDSGGVPASSMDPIISDCANGSIFGNELCVLQNMRLLHSAQQTYAATVGGGNYGSFQDLYAAGLIPESISSGSVGGYIYNGTRVAANQTSPAAFTFAALPVAYQLTGVRSFFIDQTGILRGGDKSGASAGPSDPPINF